MLGRSIGPPCRLGNPLALFVPERKHAILTVCCAAGPRTSQALHLRPRDIGSLRMVIRVEQGKGAKDGYVMLSPQILKVPHDSLLAISDTPLGESWGHRPKMLDAGAAASLRRMQRTARRRIVTDHDWILGLQGALSDERALQIAMRRVEIAERAFIASRQSADLAARVAKADMGEEMERAMQWDRPIPPTSPLMAKIDAALETRRMHAMQVLDAMDRLISALTVLRRAMKGSESCQDAAAIVERCVSAMADTTDFADDILPKR